MLGLQQVIRVEAGLYFHPKRLDEAKRKTVAFLQHNREMTVAQFKDLLGGISRKYAMPLLNHFDGLGITLREGDIRVLVGD